MADQTLNTLNLTSVIAPEIQNAFNRKAPISGLIQSKVGFNTVGPNWTVGTAGHAATTFAEGASAPSAASDGQVPAQIAWGNYNSAFTVSDHAQRNSKMSPDPRVNLDVFKKNILGAASAIAKKVETDFFTGSGSNSIIGLDNAIDNANTYAGINRASAAYWRSTVVDAEAASLTKDQLLSDISSIRTTSGESPNVAFCTPSTFNKVAALFESQRRYLGADVKLGITGPAGSPVIDVYGTQFIQSAGDGTDDVIYYCNTDHMHFEIVPWLDDVTGQSMSDGVGFVKLAKTGHNSDAMLRLQVQLVLDNPFSFGKRVNIG